MNVRVSGKHMEIGDAFRTRIDDHINDAITKYFDGGYSAQVIVEKSGPRFSADCRVHLDTGVVLHANGEALDPQQAFEAAAQRIEKRLRRYKRRLKDHHPHSQNGHEIAYSVVESEQEIESEVAEDYAPAIIAESTRHLGTMSVASAVMALDMTDERLLMFKNAGNDALNVVYRRDDGNIGWIDSGNNKS